MISVVGIFFCSGFLVTVLSAFNGLDELVKTIFRTFDAEIKISPAKGKTFELTEDLLAKIASVEGVGMASQVIEDDGVLKYNDRSVVVKFKGVEDNYFQQNEFSSTSIKGRTTLVQDSTNMTLIGQGVMYKVGVPMNDQFTQLVLWYVRNTKNPRKAPFPSPVKVAGVFAVEKQFDDKYIFIPLEMAENLTEFKGRRTAIELKTKEGFIIDDVKTELINVLGLDYKIQNSDEQHQSLYKAHAIEKFMTFMIFVFILFIGSLTIFFTLSMQVIEKKQDISIMLSMGFNRKTIRNIFLLNGMIIGFFGMIGGISAAYVLLWFQENYGLVSMGMETALVQAYPIKMIPIDFVITAITMLIVSFIISIYPAKKAMNVVIGDNV